MAVVGLGMDSSTNANISTGSLAPGVMTYYEKVFLSRAEYELILDKGGQRRTHPIGSGRTVNFTRYQPMTVVTTPIGECSNPVTCSINACTVAMTLSEYGMTTPTSKLGSLVSIDSNMKEMVSLVGQNMGETLNKLTGNELLNGTSYYGNDHSVTSFAAGDTLDACDIRMIVQKLEIKKARKYPDGLYLGKTDPYGKVTLLADTTWINAKTYSDVKDLYTGEMGELYQVRWLLNKDIISGIEACASASSGVTRFWTFVHGQDAFGVYDLEQDKPKLYVLANCVDSNSPAGRISFVSWAGSYSVKVLNSDWLQTCRFAAV